VKISGEGEMLYGKDFSSLAPKRSLVWPASPTFLQWTGASDDRFEVTCDRRLEEAGSDLRHRRAGIGAKPASVLKMPTLRIAALPRGAN
jgi:hypothetical protein